MIYYAFSDYLKQRYGEKVYKLPIGLPLTCPNRDGSCGKFGCTFCGSIGAGYENLPPELSVSEQIRMNKEHIVPKYKAKKFIPYFQNFSNTYMPPEQLEAYVREACQSDDVVAVYIATRPDCINDVYLEILARIATEKISTFVWSSAYRRLITRRLPKSTADTVWRNISTPYCA